MLYLVTFILVSIIFTVFLLLKVNILLEYVRQGERDELVLSFFTLGGLIKYKYEIPLLDIGKTGLKFKRVKEKGKKEKDYDKKKGLLKFNEIYNQIKAFKRFNEKYRDLICWVKKYIKGRLVLKEFNLNIDMGTGDAFYTGILSGLVWTAAGIIVSFMASNFKIIKKCVDVKTDFGRKKFNIDLYCIFSVRIVHIIVVALKILFSTLNKKPKVNRVRRNLNQTGF